MPVSVSLPGVYVEESPSGVRTITGVNTSTAAFAGWSARGALSRAELVLNWSDFVRRFGGFDPRSVLGYAVSHFFANGGQRAHIVRLAMSGTQDAAANVATAKAVIDGKIAATASSPGAWAGRYAIVTKRRPPPDDSRFQLAVLELNEDGTGTPAEIFESLSMVPGDPRHVADIVNEESFLVNVAILDGATGTPADTVIPPGGVIPAGNRLTGGADGNVLQPNDTAFEDVLLPNNKEGGIYALDDGDRFNLLCVPGASKPSVQKSLQGFCRERSAFYIADCAADASVSSLRNGPGELLNDAGNTALYFPWVLAPDPLQNDSARAFPPCGLVAGVFARTEAGRGVWKSPAGLDANLIGVLDVKTKITDSECDLLNRNAINCIRTLPGHGTVVWGARTLQGGDGQNSEWKYIAVRRTALFIEQSLDQGLKWVVSEPNAEPLWAQIRANVGAFMQDLFRQDAFQGQSPQQAYFVKCGSDTTTQNDIDAGFVNIVVGFAPLKPAEFVIISLRQLACRPRN